MQITGYKILIIDTHDNDRVLVEERTQRGAPVLQYNGSDDKYGVLMTSELTFNFSVPGVEDGKFFHLYTGSDTRYRVELRDQDSALLWAGFLMPDQYTEPYRGGHLFVGMTATDGVGRIKGKNLPSQYYEQETSVIKLIAECLKLTGLNQPINFAAAVLPTNGYRWDEIAVDGTNYREENKGSLSILFSKKQQKKDSGYVILERLMQNIGCTLYNYAGQWDIIGINRKHERSCAVAQYSADGVFLGYGEIKRPASRVRFKNSPPNVITKSPWKRINITWAIDEDGNLLPEDIITEAADKYSISTGNPFVDSGNHGLPDEAPLKYWQTVGSIGTGVASSEGEYTADVYLGSWGVPVFVGPYNFNILKQYVSYPYHVSGETTEGTAFNYVQLKTPKYIKVSDQYQVRTLKFKVGVFGINAMGMNPINTDAVDANGKNVIDLELLQNLFRCEIWSGTTLVASNKPGASSARNFKFEVDYRSGSESLVEDPPQPGLGNIVNFHPATITGTLDKENILVLANGFLNVRFFGAVTPTLTTPQSMSPNSPVITSYTFTDFELEYTASDEWYDALVRNIDYTTVLDLDIYHGDSIQDLSKKQFRFRRAITTVVTAPNAVLMLGYSAQLVGVTGGAEVRWWFNVSYQTATTILQNAYVNPASLQVQYSGNTYSVESLYTLAGQQGFLTNWWVEQDAGTGVWRIVIRPLNGVVYPIFSSIDNFSTMLLGNIPEGGSTEVVLGYVTENNEERESWARYGVVENRRFGLCLGRVYHDVQKNPYPSIEGDLFGIYNPREILSFDWMGLKDFIPLRLTWDLSNGFTNVTMAQATHELVDDYGFD